MLPRGLETEADLPTPPLCTGKVTSDIETVHEIKQMRGAITIGRAEPHREDTCCGVRRNPPRQFALMAPSDGGPGAIQFRRRKQIVNVPAQSLYHLSMSSHTRGQPARPVGTADIDIPAGRKLEFPQTSDSKPLRARQPEQQRVCARLCRSRHGRTTRGRTSENWSRQPSAGASPSPPAPNSLRRLFRG
jgi:hypothetical protein